MKIPKSKNSKDTYLRLYHLLLCMQNTAVVLLIIPLLMFYFKNIEYSQCVMLCQQCAWDVDKWCDVILESHYVTFNRRRICFAAQNFPVVIPSSSTIIPLLMFYFKNKMLCLVGKLRGMMAMYE